MKTAEEIMVYMERELVEAHEMHEQFKGQDKQEALIQLIRATTILNLLEGIKADEEPPEATRRITPGHLERKLMNGEITEEEYKKKKLFHIETLFELYERDIITEEELKDRLNK